MCLFLLSSTWPNNFVEISYLHLLRSTGWILRKADIWWLFTQDCLLFWSDDSWKPFVTAEKSLILVRIVQLMNLCLLSRLLCFFRTKYSNFRSFECRHSYLMLLTKASHSINAKLRLKLKFEWWLQLYCRNHCVVEVLDLLLLNIFECCSQIFLIFLI